MKVFVNGKVYDSEEIPIAIVLEPIDRLHIIAMPPDSFIYVSVPDGSTAQQMQDFQYALGAALKEQKDPVGGGSQEESSDEPLRR
jgi:hypothetical protein